jgi:spore coat polysaccharide biosynthesis protein SpsF (cytidylyltransferase family)
MRKIGMDEKTYYLVLSPDLEITPEAFTVAWNETAETRSIGQIRLSQTQGAQFDMTFVAAILLSVATNLASNALYDRIKEVIQRLQDKSVTQGKPVHKHIHIEEQKKADGTYRLVVDIDED